MLAGNSIHVAVAIKQSLGFLRKISKKQNKSRPSLNDLMAYRNSVDLDQPVCQYSLFSGYMLFANNIC